MKLYKQKLLTPIQLPSIVTGVLVTGISLFSSHYATAADSIGSDENPLNKVVVTATRSEKSVGSIAGKVQVIDSEELNRQLQAGDNLSTALGRLIPNLGVGTETSTGATQTIRGRKPLYLIDGIPQSDNRDVSRFLNSISPAFVERIEVVTGASSIYGVGGTGGVINIITRSGANQQEGVSFTTEVGASVSGEAIERDSVQANVAQTITYKKGNFDGFVGLEYTNTRGYYDSNGERIAAEPAQTSTNDSDISSGQLKLGWQLDNEKRLQFNYDQFDSEQDSDFGPNYGGPGVPVLFSGQSTSAIPVAGLQLDEQPKTERQSMSLQYHDKNIFGSELTALVYQREREYRFFPFAFTVDPSNVTGTSFINQSTSKADVIGTKIVLDTDINSAVSIVYGVDYQRDKGEQKAVGFDQATFIGSGGLNHQETSRYDYGPDVQTDTLGAFAEVAFYVNDYLLIRGGLRYEKIEQDIDDYLPPFEFLLIPEAARQTINGDSIKYNEVLTNLGAVVTFNPQQQIFLNYSQGFELPDLARLLRNSVAPTSLLTQGSPIGTVISDIDIDAIKVDSYELGWRGSWDSVDASATLFYNESDKTTVFNPDLSVTQLDQEKRIYGVELSMDYYLNDTWSTGLNGSYTQGKTKDSQTDRDLYLDAQEVAPTKLVTYVGYDFANNSRIRLQATSVLDYDKAQINVGGTIVDDGDIDGYTTLDLLTQWQLPVGEVNLNITNLTNQDYQTVYSQWAEDTFGTLSGIPAQGRTIGLSYRVSY